MMVQILSRAHKYSTALFDFFEIEVEFPSNVKVKLDKVVPKKQESVLIIPMYSDNSLVFVSEFCAVTESYVTKFPTGTLKENESPNIAANRELAEEIGLKSESLNLLGTLLDSPGYSCATTDVFLAKNLIICDRDGGDEPEPLNTRVYDRCCIAELIRKGEFGDSRSIAAMLLLESHL